ncbi:hypothetical protein SEA_LEOPARD_1 [Mycobacterium phage Leopard]|nr:hypothetical protein SEA_LEOPARD_1 [Mycobacterium phage Leopard]
MRDMGVYLRGVRDWWDALVEWCFCEKVFGVNAEYPHEDRPMLGEYVGMRNSNTRHQITRGTRLLYGPCRDRSCRAIHLAGGPNPVKRKRICNLCRHAAHGTRMCDECLCEGWSFAARTRRACSRVRAAGRRLALMARDPFMYDRDETRDESSEFGFGRGHHPDPSIDYSDGGSKSRIPIADPTAEDQQMTLQMLRRMDVNDPNAQLDPYALGNTDRYGAQPPLVRERRAPKGAKRTPRATPRMRREW